MIVQTKKAAFLDRDGIINVNFGYVYQIDALQWTDGIFDLLRLLQKTHLLIIVTNQSGIAFGKYNEEDFWKLMQHMKLVLKDEGITLTDILFCPHHPNALLDEYRKDCVCRKPKEGMMITAQHRWFLDMEQSLMIGDSPRDISAANAAHVGCTIWVSDEANEKEAEDIGATYYFKNISSVYQYLINGSEGII